MNTCANLFLEFDLATSMLTLLAHRPNSGSARNTGHLLLLPRGSATGPHLHAIRMSVELTLLGKLRR
jgi:hypothetical protein